MNVPVVEEDVWDPEISRLDDHTVHSAVLGGVPGHLEINNALINYDYNKHLD